MESAKYYTHTQTDKEDIINIQTAELVEIQLTGEKSSTVKLKSSIAAEKTKDKRIGFKSHQWYDRTLGRSYQI